MHITKTFGQYKKGIGPATLESDFNVEVDYDPSEHVVREIIKVWSYNYRYRTVTDLTAVFAETLPAQLREIIELVDWFDLYCETTHKQNKVA